MEFHILPNFRFPCLLGLDIGTLFRLQLDLGSSTVSTPPTRSHRFIASYLAAAENDALDAVLNKHVKIFATSDTDIGRIDIAKHSIITNPHPPIQRRPYRRSASEYDEIRTQVEQLKRQNLIRDSTSPWAFPVTLVPKKDGGKRMCVDYRQLNAITIDDKMPLPLIQEVVDRLRGARYFSTLDIAWGYWHIAMDPDSITKTAFVTNEGHYEWLVMPFGLKNAPATFQRIVQQILGTLLYNGVINYLDDFIIYSDSFESHMALLDQVLAKLKSHHIKLKLSKCKFAKTEVEYLGHIIKHNRVEPSPSKIAAIKSFPIPSNLREVRRFIGLAGYYRRFIQNFSRIAQPLTDLTKKDQPFEWSTDCQTAFSSLQSALVKPPILAMFDPSQPCVLYTDASKTGIGAILCQGPSKKEQRVVAYHSKRLDKNQQNYTTSELECFAIIHAVQHFRNYLDKPFTIVTDHSALRWLHHKNPSGKLYRWSLLLSTFNFKIIHKPGTSQAHVDALSRAPVLLYLDTSEIVKAQKSSDLSYVRNPVTKDNMTFIRHRGLTRVVTPPALHQKLLQTCHDEHGHPGINKTVRIISSRYWWLTMVKDIRSYVFSCRSCQLTKASHQPTPGHYVAPSTDLQPLSQLGMDTIVLGTAASNTKHKYILTIVDHFSRYLWAYPLIQNSTESVINCLHSLFSSGSVPVRILTDNAQNFTSSKLHTFLKKYSVKQTFTSPYRPQTNGICEKLNGTIMQSLRAFSLDYPTHKWSTLLPKVVSSYNNTPHDITDFTPNFLFSGISKLESESEVDLDAARQLARSRSEQHCKKRKAKHDLIHPSLEFQLNDLVLKRIAENNPIVNKLTPKYEGPFRISTKLSAVTYDLTDSSGRISRAHISQLRPFTTRCEIPTSGE